MNYITKAGLALGGAIAAVSLLTGCAPDKQAPKNTTSAEQVYFLPAKSNPDEGIFVRTTKADIDSYMDTGMISLTHPAMNGIHISANPSYVHVGTLPYGGKRTYYDIRANAQVSSSLEELLYSSWFGAFLFDFNTDGKNDFGVAYQTENGDFLETELEVVDNSGKPLFKSRDHKPSGGNYNFDVQNNKVVRINTVNSRTSDKCVTQERIKESFDYKSKSWSYVDKSQLNVCV